MAKKRESAREAIARLETWIQEVGVGLPAQEMRRVVFGRTPAPKAAERIRMSLSESHATDYLNYVIDHGPTSIMRAAKNDDVPVVRILAPNQAKKYDDRVEDIGMLAGDDQVWNVRVFAAFGDDPIDVMVFDRSQRRPGGELRMIRWTDGEYTPEKVTTTFAAWVSQVVDAEIELMTAALPNKAHASPSKSDVPVSADTKKKARSSRAAKAAAAAETDAEAPKPKRKSTRRKKPAAEAAPKKAPPKRKTVRRAKAAPKAEAAPTPEAEPKKPAPKRKSKRKKPAAAAEAAPAAEPKPKPKPAAKRKRSTKSKAKAKPKPKEEPS